MTWEPVLLSVLLVVFLATLTQSTFGFGNALLAMPMLELMLEVRVVHPLVAMLAFTVALSVVLRDGRQIQLRGSSFFIGFSLLGVPVGIIWLHVAPEALIKSLLGLLVMGFALVSLSKHQLRHLSNDRWAGWFGFGSGVLGGAYNTYGPLLVIYGTLRNWPRDRFRATLQGCFLPTSVFILVIHAVSGWWTSRVLLLYAFCFPAALLGLILGRALSKRVSQQRFLRYVYTLLFLLGAMLVIREIVKLSSQ